jgi:hypothetical protein
MSQIKKALGTKGLVNIEDLPDKVMILNQQYDSLNQVCESIAKALGFDHFDDEQILLEIERLQETDEGRGYWHNQYKELLKEFRAYTSDSGAHVAYKYLNEIVGALGLDSFRYCDLPEKVAQLHKVYKLTQKELVEYDESTIKLISELLGLSETVNGETLKAELAKFKAKYDDQQKALYGVNTALGFSGDFHCESLPKMVANLAKNQIVQLRLHEDMLKRETNYKQTIKTLEGLVKMLESETQYDPSTIRQLENRIESQSIIITALTEKLKGLTF